MWINSYYSNILGNFSICENLYWGCGCFGKALFKTIPDFSSFKLILFTQAIKFTSAKLYKLVLVGLTDILVDAFNRIFP